MRSFSSLQVTVYPLSENQRKTSEVMRINKWVRRNHRVTHANIQRSSDEIIDRQLVDEYVKREVVNINV